MKTFKAIIPSLKTFLRTHKEQILFASGVAGTISTGVTGVRAGVRIEKKRRQLELEKGEPLTKKEMIKVALPELIPVGLSAGGTIGCNAAMYMSFKTKVESAVATIGALSTRLDKMVEAEKEVLGEEKAEEVQKKVVERVSDDVPKSPSGYHWFKEDYTEAEVYTTAAEIEKAVGTLNLQLTWNEQSVNDFFYLIDKKDCTRMYTKANDNIGWESGTVLQADTKHSCILSNGETGYLLKLSEEPTTLRRKAFR